MMAIITRLIAGLDPLLFSLALIALASPGSCSTSHEPAQQLPFLAPPPRSPPAAAPTPLRVAIIGGGAAGTSAAFFLSQFANASRAALETEIFERSDILGGRAALVWPFDSDAYPPVEAGASMFVPANKHLHRAVEAFNLSAVPFGEDEDVGPLAIWDGTEFAYEETGSKWWDLARLFWRYGRAPFQLDTLTKRTVAEFEAIYEQGFVARGPFEGLDEWARAAGLARLLPVTGTEELVENEGVNVQAVNELAAIAARVNYGQDVCSLHALGTMISLAGGQGASVKGGNRQVFEQFAARSGARVRLAHQVAAVSRLADSRAGRPQYVLSYRAHTDAVNQTATTTADSGPFDAVIIAAPFHQTGIALLSIDKPAPVPAQPYVHLHVTFVVTNATAPSGLLFNRPPDSLVPRTIYSTMMRNVLGKGKRPFFNSISYLANLGQKDGVVGDMHIVKIFSESKLSNERIDKIFGNQQNVQWIKKLEWDAYPILKPLKNQNEFPPTELSDGIYYTNGFETLISTMETQTLSSWNLMSLISKKYFNYLPKRGWNDEKLGKIEL